MLDKIFGRSKKKGEEEVIEPAIQFGRYSDNNKPVHKVEKWNEADNLFKEKKYHESIKAFFDYLTDEEVQNVVHQQMSCRLIDARFPDYKVVIPTNNPYKLVLEKSAFQSALRRVSVFSNKSTNQVALNITGSELGLQAQDVDFSFEGAEKMKCQYDGEDLTIAFNARFLIEMLNAAESDQVKVELSTPTKAGILKPTEAEDGEELLMLVMPLMLNQ